MDLTAYRQRIRTLARRQDGQAIYNATVEHATIVVEHLFSNAGESVDILTGSLNPRVYGRDPVIKEAQLFLLTSQQNRIRIILEEDAEGIRMMHPLLMALKPYENVEVKYGGDKLDEIQDAREVPETAYRSENFRAIVNLAEKPKGRFSELNRTRSWTYAIFLRPRIDRFVSWILAGVGLVGLCIGSAHAVGEWQSLAPLFCQDRIAWSLWSLVTCVVLSVLFAVLGEWVVRGTFMNIDKYTEELMNLMPRKMQKEASEASVASGVPEPE